MADIPGSTLAEVLAAARAALVQAQIADAALDARLIVEHFSGTSRAEAISTPERIIGQDLVDAVERALQRRIRGEPVHRILGFREFFGLRLALSAETLEPRPDTETLVYALLPLVRAAAARGEGVCRILDLGTGTGAIALALLTEVDEATATGVDISAEALATARSNATALGIGDRFTTVESDWFSRISGKFHVIAANPPYIPSNELMTLQREVKDFDPARALDGGPDGLDAYRAISRQAGEHLDAGGSIAVEIGYGQRDEVSGLFQLAGYRIGDVRRDIAGRDRVLVFHR